jgi:hypothetical protein
VCRRPAQRLSGINSRHTQPRMLIACQLLNRPRLRDAFRLARVPRHHQSARLLQRKHESARPSLHTSVSPEGRVEPSSKAGSHGGPHRGTHYHDDVHTSTVTGVTTIIPPNRLSTQIRVHVPPILDGTKAHRTKHGHNMLHQRMERPKDQRPLHLCAIGKAVHAK